MMTLGSSEGIAMKILEENSRFDLEKLCDDDGRGEVPSTRLKTQLAWNPFILWRRRDGTPSISAGEEQMAGFRLDTSSSKIRLMIFKRKGSRYDLVGFNTKWHGGTFELSSMIWDQPPERGCECIDVGYSSPTGDQGHRNLKRRALHREGRSDREHFGIRDTTVYKSWAVAQAGWGGWRAVAGSAGAGKEERRQHTRCERRTAGEDGDGWGNAGNLETGHGARDLRLPTIGVEGWHTDGGVGVI
ncbi:hypothetical protein JB92DRAFT_3095407 [Gautieria morchelliformis]|nr:hypothetical protein JB92DRAFT_3095407 [Gautieria morchelliformis]